MSQQPSIDDPARIRLTSFLRERTRRGERFFKSRDIADEVDLSPQEVGALMLKLRTSASAGLEVEKWSAGSPVTWQVDPV